MNTARIIRPTFFSDIKGKINEPYGFLKDFIKSFSLPFHDILKNQPPAYRGLYLFLCKRLFCIRSVIQRRFDDLLNARRHTGWVRVQAFDQQRAIIDLFDDQRL